MKYYFISFLCEQDHLSGQRIVNKFIDEHPLDWFYKQQDIGWNADLKGISFWREISKEHYEKYKSDWI